MRRPVPCQRICLASLLLPCIASARALGAAPPAPSAFYHHAEPNRLDLLFLPIWFLAALLAASAALFWLVFGAYAVASLVFGVGLAILHYEWTHYLAHIPYQPHTAWGRYIKRYHLRHHFISEK